MSNFSFDEEFYSAFGVIASTGSFPSHTMDIVALICNEELTEENIGKVLRRHHVKNIIDIKRSLLDLLISYINIILENRIITDAEKRNLDVLKLHFKIREGDFYKLRYKQVEEILHRQFEMIYLDCTVTPEEAEYSFNLQDIFDLSYDQFDQLKDKEIEKALSRGADISNLDTARVKFAKLQVK